MSTSLFKVNKVEVNLINKPGSESDGHTQVVYILGSSWDISDPKTYRKSVLFKPDQTAQIALFEKMVETGDYSALQKTVDMLQYELINVSTPPYYLLDSDKAIRLDKETKEPIVVNHMKVLIPTRGLLDDEAKHRVALSEATATIKRICKWVETQPHTSTVPPTGGTDAKPKHDPITGELL